MPVPPPEDLGRALALSHSCLTPEVRFLHMTLSTFTLALNTLVLQEGDGIMVDWQHWYPGTGQPIYVRWGVHRWGRWSERQGEFKEPVVGSLSLCVSFFRGSLRVSVVVCRQGRWSVEVAMGAIWTCSWISVSFQWSASEEGGLVRWIVQGAGRTQGSCDVFLFLPVDLLLGGN